MNRLKTLSKTRTLLLALIFIAIAFLSCIRGNSSSKIEKNVKSIKNVNELKDVIKSAGDKLVLIDLYADWCIPCKKLSPLLANLSEIFKESVLFYKIDIDKNPGIAQLFKVAGIPLVIFIKNQAVVYALQGLASENEYIRIIKR
ncbi:MAG: thioredoxin domain-containing protein, partial [Spirochaetota bacterium]|nr:thioredoxin domain-containing protein [Spirochaetota bacterium]